MKLPGAIFRPKLEKKQNPSRKKFLILRETETPKKIPYISGNGSTKKRLIFREMELSSLGSKNKKNPPRENFLYSGKWNFLTLILKKFV